VAGSGGAAAARGRRGHYSAWRTLAAAPAMAGSTLLLVVLLAGLGRWEGVVLLAWVAAGLLLLTRRGERLAVRAWCGFRRPTGVQARAVQPVWRAALARCRIDPGEVDLYVQRCPGPNAYAAGAHSVAVTTGVLSLFLARRVSDGDLEAVLVHELGHHATRGVRFTLVTVWLAAPWRLAAMGVLRLSAGLAGRRQPGWLITLLAAVVVTIAVVQAAARGEWSTVLILTTLVVGGVGAPLADAAVSRASERAADRYAAAAGVGFGLAYALHAVDRGRGRRAGVARRALSRHPPVEQRVEVLLAATAASLQPLPPTRTP